MIRDVTNIWALGYLAALTQKKSPLIQLLEVEALDCPTPQEI
jgi:hypothetical protein